MVAQDVRGPGALVLTGHPPVDGPDGGVGDEHVDSRESLERLRARALDGFEARQVDVQQVDAQFWFVR